MKYFSAVYIFEMVMSSYYDSFVDIPKASTSKFPGLNERERKLRRNISVHQSMVEDWGCEVPLLLFELASYSYREDSQKFDFRERKPRIKGLIVGRQEVFQKVRYFPFFSNQDEYGEDFPGPFSDRFGCPLESIWFHTAVNLEQALDRFVWKFRRQRAVRDKPSSIGIFVSKCSYAMADFFHISLLVI